MPFRPTVFFIFFATVLSQSYLKMDAFPTNLAYSFVPPLLSQSYLKMDAFPTDDAHRRRQPGRSQSYLKMDAFPTLSALRLSQRPQFVAILPKNGCLSDRSAVAFRYYKNGRNPT